MTETGTLFTIDWVEKKISWHTCILFDSEYSNILNVDAILYRRKGNLSDNESFFNFKQKQELKNYFLDAKKKMKAKRISMDPDTHSISFHNTGCNFPIDRLISLFTDNNIYSTNPFYGKLLESLAYNMTT